jgi:ABC-type maltose transport system permease subunit
MSSSTPTITFAFNIIKLNVLPNLTINDTTLTNVVTSIIYQYIGTASSNNQTCIITGESLLNKPTLENYKDYHELTEEEVLSWLQSTVNVEKHQSDITNYLNGNNIISLPLPWQAS